MPNVTIIHQNLMNFAGGYERTWKFRNAFGLIRDDLVGNNLPQPIMAAFTEVESSGTDVQDCLTDIAGNAVTGGTNRRTLVIEIGLTAVGQAVEYVGINYDSTQFNLSRCGHVLRVDGVWRAFDSTQTSGALELPANENVSPDFRGVAYAVGTIGETPFIIGFVHNVYTVGEKSILPQALPNICGDLGGNYNLGYYTTYVVGGDFNVNPQDRLGSVNLEAIAASNNGQFLNTTASHAYDYWMCSSNVHLSRPWISPRTRNKSLEYSDHAASILQFDAV